MSSHKKTIRLADHCSVFQAEICAIYVAINWLKTNRESVLDVCILSDSQAALRTQDSPHITWQSVLTRRISFEEMAIQMNICQVPGHRNIPDELAREGTTRELQSLHNDYGIPIATLKLKFEEESIKEANLRWLNASV